MKKIFILALGLLTISAIIYLAINPRFLTNVITEQTVSMEPKTYDFSELGISLEVPAALEVSKEPIPNLDDSSKLDAYTFTIQNHPDSKGLGTKDFQIYGLYQFDLPKITLEQFDTIKTDPEGFSYVTEFDVDGLKGFEAQYDGGRNNYIYFFYLKEQVLRITVSPATPGNKDIAEGILRTLFTFTPAE